MSLADGEHHVVIVGGGFGRPAPQLALSPANIAAPLRSLVKRQPDTHVRLGEVVGFDLDARRVRMRDGELGYDSLIVAAGAGQSWFGHAEWAEIAPGLKTLEDAPASAAGCCSSRWSRSQKSRKSRLGTARDGDGTAGVV